MDEFATWTVGGMVEHGSFLMALASVALSCLVILLALSGIIAYVRVRQGAREVAAEEARKTAHTLAERAANDYLQAEIPAIIAAYGSLGQEVDAALADQAAEKQDNENGR